MRRRVRGRSSTIIGDGEGAGKNKERERAIVIRDIVLCISDITKQLSLYT